MVAQGVVFDLLRARPRGSVLRCLRLRNVGERYRRSRKPVLLPALAVSVDMVGEPMKAMGGTAK
jgi:hypothetical protein